MEQELFKAIFKLEGDNANLLASLDEVNSKYKEQNRELERQKINLKNLTDNEAQLLKGRAAAQNPTQAAKYNKLLEETRAKIDKVRTAMENLTVTDQKAGKAQDDLGKKIAVAFDATKINAARTEVEKFTKTLATGDKPVQSLRAQLKALKAQLAETDDDQEFLRLSVEAGKLKDKIDDANQAAQIFATDSPFQAVGNGIRGVAGDLLSMDFAGAAQKSQLLVQATKQITFKGSLEGIKQLGTTLLNVGKSLLLNPIFLIGAAVAAIIANFDKLKESGGLVGKIFTFIGDTVNAVTKAFTDLTDAIGLTDIAASKAADSIAKSILKTRDIAIQAVNNRYNYEIAAAKAAGKSVVDLEIAKRDEIIKTYNAAIKAQFDTVDGTEKSIQKAIAFERAANAEIRTLEREKNLIRIEEKKRADEEAKRLAEKAAEEREKEIEAEIKARQRQREFEEGGTADLARIQKEQQEIADKAEIEAKQNQEQTKQEIDLVNSAKSVDIKRHELEEKERLDKEALEKKRALILKEIDMIAQVATATINAAKQVVNARIAEVDKLRSIQEKRLEDAKDIADKGNAKQLELEQKRLDALTQQREKFVAQQQALATLELIANTSIAVSKAAAQGGVAAGITIAAALIALVGGLAAGRSIANQAAFYDGGYTGDGDPRQESTAIGRKPYTYHKGEFVFNHEKTGKYKEIFHDIHNGNIDLNEWQRKVNAFEAMKFTPGANVDFSTIEKKLDAVVAVIQGQSTSFSLDENGLSMRFQNIRTRNDFIKNRLAK